MIRWIGKLGTALMLVAATGTAGQAQQQGMMRGQMHGDTTPETAPCPTGMGGMGMMEMTRGRGMMGMMHGAAGHSAGIAPMRSGMMGGGMGMTGGMPMMGKSGMMGAGPSMLLAQRDVLELTDDQAQRLEQLQAEKQAMMKEMHEGMTAVRSEMRDAMGAGSPDLEAYRSALETMADQMVSHHMQRAQFQQQVLDVLTTVQRDRLQTGMRMMRHMMSDPGTGG